VKYQVTADEYTALSDDLKALYGSESDGKHTLKIEGMPEVEDVSGLKKKVDELLEEKKAEQKARKAAEAKAAEDARLAAQKSGDVEAINASWQAKYDADLAAANEKYASAESMLKHEKVHSQAVSLANLLAVPGSADVLLPHIESRLSMEIRDGRAVAVVKDREGKPSALTVEELGKEIANNAAFAPLIVASNAAGGGANGKQNGRAAGKTLARSEFDKLPPQAAASFFRDGGKLTD
jgi:hypothetical protein